MTLRRTQGDSSLANPLLALPGAVEGAGPDAGVAAHYGNPLGEQRSLAEGAAIVDLSHRGVLAVTGPDRLSWLDSLLSQRLTGLAPDASAEALLLDPTGRIEHAIGVLDDGETSWLIVDGAELDSLRTFLDRMRFLLRVEVADRTDDVAVIGGFADLPNFADLPVWIDPWTSGSVGGATTARPHGGHPASTDWGLRLWLSPRNALGGIADAVLAGTLRLAGTSALEALRIAAWRPRFAREVDARSIPHELDWLRSAVHLNKGCYRGQETVAKVFNLGRPPRRIVELDLDGSEGVLPAPGAIVRSGETEVGVVTSAALHHESGPIALAVIKRSTDPTVLLSVETDAGPVAAAQRVIVPADLAPAVTVPRLPRVGGVRR